jgi:hypothetical protein
VQPPEHPTVPAYVPEELVARYGEEARQRVRATGSHAPPRPVGGRERFRPPPGGRAVLASLLVVAAGLATFLGLHAASWLVGVIMFMMLALMCLLGLLLPTVLPQAAGSGARRSRAR